MNIKELGQLGLAYSMRSRTGVTAALHRVANKLELPIDFSKLENCDDKAFWQLIQSTMDKILASVQQIIKKALEEIS